jgi:outer membrane protein
MKIKLFLILLTVLSTTIAISQSQTLTLSSAVDIARGKNVSVIQAQNTLEAQQAGTLAAYGGLLPSVGATGRFSRVQRWSPGGIITDPVTGLPYATFSGFSASNSWSSGLSAQMVIFNGFANTSNVTRAEAQVNAAEQELSRTRQQTVFATHQLYLNIYRTFQLMKVSEDNLKRSKRQLERIIESNRVGAVALADVYRQQVQVGADELALIQAQSNYEKAKADLLAFLGTDLNAEYVFDFEGIPSDIDTSEFSSINRQYSDFPSLVKKAVEVRPDYRSVIENYNSADASVTIAKSGHLPTLSAYTSFGFTNEEFSRITDNKNLSFGLDVSIPIFNGFSTQYQIEQAHVQRKNAEENLKQAERQIVVDLRKALLDLESAEKQVTVTQTSVISAEMDRKIAEEKYNLGAGTLLDLLVAHANYTASVSNKVNAVIGYLLAKKQVELAIGIISH